MVQKNNKYRWALIAAMTMLLAFPLISSGKGKDWYCPDTAGHAQYEQHLKIHLDHSAKAISESIEKIYLDSSLTPEQKKAETMKILRQYLSKKSAGTGD